MFGGNKPGTPGGFSFSSTPSTGTTPGLSLGTATTTTTAATTGGFSFGATGGTGAVAGFGKPAAAATGFSLGGNTATPAIGLGTPGFSFNSAVTSTPAAQVPKSNVTPTVNPGGGFSFGATAPAATPSLGLGAATPLGTGIGAAKTSTSGTPGFSFGLQSTSTPTAAAGLSLGTTPVATTAPATSTAGGFSFGQMSGAGATLGGLKTATTSAAPSIGFNLAGAPPATSAAGGLTLGAASATTIKPPGTGLNLGATSTAPASTGLGLSTATSTAGLGLLTSAANKSTASVLPSTTTTTTVAGPSKQMTYHQLEDAINKWTTELSEQEKIFLQQATQVNAWDRLVMENGEKIIQLSQDVDKVKTDQQKLDHEIDFIHAQQRELEELLQPLEKSLEQLPPISFQQHADLQREHTYQLAESIDAQMKRMGQDLKETIERLNATNSKTDPHDPVQQITKILNAHMDSLLWIDRNSAALYRRVEDISKEMDSQRKEQERNYRLVYN
ncbi:hypothetical protein SNE40_003599 [Patella caerulea]|uniref:Nucleoporin NSP1-like C-terminal domain-containing protein n=1 Tax=Patella caerulea TaxID=87958 RepID=A0AAN8K3B8_PATCE